MRRLRKNLHPFTVEPQSQISRLESMDLTQKSAALHQILGSLDSLLVAYSGGTDSAYLAYAAHRALGGRMLAVIADSASLPRQELAAALAFASEHGIPVHILQTRELEDPNYARNDHNRCFHCKNELFTQMEAARVQLGFQHLAYGMKARTFPRSRACSSRVRRRARSCCVKWLDVPCEGRSSVGPPRRT